jgi:hypothetical protein
MSSEHKSSYWSPKYNSQNTYAIFRVVQTQVVSRGTEIRFDYAEWV